jgi:hypothetical protein
MLPVEPADETAEEEPFSVRLEAWLKADRKKTLGDLTDRFDNESFALLFVLLLAVAALPIPTGGVTHVLEVVAMLLALELIVGRSDIWIPKRWIDRELPALGRPAFAEALLKRVRWFERFARPRGSWFLERRLTNILYGLAVFGFSLVAFLAPPFSGLDTLPALGVVVMSLGVLFGDAVIALAGVAIGGVGVALVVGLGHLISKLF